jgi:hypothetical protein
MTEGSVRERYGDFVAERIKEREQQQLDFYSILSLLANTTSVGSSFYTYSRGTQLEFKIKISI